MFARRLFLGAIDFEYVVSNSGSIKEEGRCHIGKRLDELDEVLKLDEEIQEDP